MSLFESKSFVISLTIISLLIIALAYISLQDTIDRAMPVLFWIVMSIIGVAILMVFIVQCEKLWTLRTQMKAARVVAEAEALKAQAVAKKESILVITAGERDQVIVRDDDHTRNYIKMDMIPNTRVNGHYEPPTDLEIQLFQTKWGSDAPMVIDQQSVTSEVLPGVDILSKYNQVWIQTLLDAPHVHYCGATRSGKTTLANHHISHLAKDSGAEFYLINPKHTAARKPFIISPNFKDIDEAIEGLQTFNTMMLKRKNDPALTGNESKMVFIIDEWDWIYETYGQQATRLLIPLVKVGAELKIQVILIGQSPLTGDTGLSQSFYHNMIRVAIWQEGARLLNNAPSDNKVKAPLKAQYEELKSIAPQCEAQTGNKLRYCTVVPMNGNPSVEVIPYLEDPMKIGRQKAIEAQVEKVPNSEEMKIFRAWQSIVKNDKAPSWNKIHHTIIGKKTNISTRKRDEYQELFDKYNVQSGL